MLAGRRKQSILIIDDTPDNLRVAVKHFEAYSFDILTARDGESGIARARLAQPDLILLDVQMPGIDGYETCRRLKAAPETCLIPVIFMTVLSDLDAKVRGFEAGGVDYVTKPMEAVELLARVKTHLQLRHLQREQAEHARFLETRVAERTAALEQALAQSAAHQREREHLLALVRSQSEQLRSLTQEWLETQRARERGLALTLQQQVAQRLTLLGQRLEQARALLDLWLHRPPTPLETQALRELLEAALVLLPKVLEETETVTEHLDNPPAMPLQDNPLLRLSTREYEVLQLMAAGKSNKEIAGMLDVARTTISTYRTRILEKLAVQDLASLLKLVLDHPLPPPEPEKGEV